MHISGFDLRRGRFSFCLIIKTGNMEVRRISKGKTDRRCFFRFSHSSLELVLKIIKSNLVKYLSFSYNDAEGVSATYRKN